MDKYKTIKKTHQTPAAPLRHRSPRSRPTGPTHNVFEGTEHVFINTHMASTYLPNKHFPCFSRTKRSALVGNSYKRLWLQGGREAVQCHHHHHHHHHHQGGRESWWEDSLLTTSTRRWKLLLSRRSRGWGDKGNFCRSKTREGQQGGRYFCHANPGAQMWRQAFRGEGRGDDSSG